MAREGLERDPTNSWQQIMALRTASRNNRPGVVIDLFRSLNPDPITPGMVIYGTNKHALEALHLMGRHAEELALAREILAAGPTETHGASVHADELLALAALGRAGEIDTLLTDVFLEPDPIIDDSQEMRYVLYELRAHGFRDEAQALAERTLAWIQNVNSGSGEACVKCEAVSLMAAGRYEEARSLYEELLAEEPENHGLAHHLGVLAAHLGDRETALEMDARIVETSDDVSPTGVPYGMRGEIEFLRAGIAAQLGDTDRAIHLLRQAVAAGYCDYMWIHSNPAFEALWDDPEFQDILRPKG